MRTLLLCALLFGIDAASAQNITIDPAPGAGSPVLDVPIIVNPELPPLTAYAASIARQRIEAYLTHHENSKLRSSLNNAGLSSVNDAVEHAAQTPSGNFAPLHVGLWRPRAPSSQDTVDPGLAESSRLVLRARLGRDPTSAELAAELKTFDDRVARVNRSLAGMRPRIADAVKRTGVFPRSLEAGVLEVAPADPQAGSAAASEGFRRLFQTLLTLPSPSQPSLPNSTPR